MKLQTFAMAAGKGFEQYGRPTKRDVFLRTMDQIVPWKNLCSVVEPNYPKGGSRLKGRPVLIA